ncbi:MAG: quinone-dependent dihydroorotate dehydrogenase [Leptospiraceae bacterium]|nr:quinone-dependent dihydroorotate dehydrogenase [Leptospiraceae bacterium]MCK6381050.1 quinone-dependent dihydroorotate dehydrogenase [Leptospiraceae bacterium]NUM40202.1 quinone-dependent dihydroorotate dehydrogenase [Leptospiraceae bacterium]
MNWAEDFLYKNFFKPLLFNLYPENAHDVSFELLKLADKIPGIFSILEKNFSFKSARLNTTVSKIQFQNPLGMAAGFDKTGEYFPFFEKLGFGYAEVGTITGEEQPGNPKPRLFRYPNQDAFINRMGFNNPGSEKAFQILSTQNNSIPMGINIGKTKVVDLENALEDYLKSYKKLYPLSDYCAINISSPNTPGLRSLQEKDTLASLVGGLRKELGGSFPIPTFIKFAPDFTDTEFEKLLDVVLDLGVQGIILTNTTLDKSLLQEKNPEEGGLSGKPLREKSTHLIRLARKKLNGRLNIIGVGGIDSGESALEKILAGADLIQIYTGYIYNGPNLPSTILKYIDNYLEENGIKNISEIVGKFV